MSSGENICEFATGTSLVQEETGLPKTLLRRVQIIVEVPNMVNSTEGLALLANRNGATGKVVTVDQNLGIFFIV